MRPAGRSALPRSRDAPQNRREALARLGGQDQSGRGGCGGGAGVTRGPVAGDLSTTPRLGSVPPVARWFRKVLVKLEKIQGTGPTSAGSEKGLELTAAELGPRPAQAWGHQEGPKETPRGGAAPIMGTEWPRAEGLVQGFPPQGCAHP